ncbi:MAG: FGGY-family carbohydrate kinase, partial [Bacillota bacterium]
KLLWLTRHEPETYRLARRLLFGAHDYIAWVACGASVTDATTASTTGLLDLASGRWAVELLEALELRTDFLPEIAPAYSVVGRLRPEAAEALGLPAGTPVVHGAGDAAATTLGAGAGEPGRTYLYLGTSGWLALTSPGDRADPSSGIFTLRHPEPSWTLLIGPMLTAAGNLEWIRRQLGDPPYEELSALVRAAPEGSGGVFYLPYLAGERSPFRDSKARAAFVGIGPGTGRAELVRSVMEGVAFALRSIADAMPQFSADPIGAAGGGCRANVWCEILAAVLKCPVRRLAGAQDVGVRGAAVLAGRALGWYRSFIPSPGFFPVDRLFVPDPRMAAAYDGLYREFRQRNPYLRRHGKEG